VATGVVFSSRRRFHDDADVCLGDVRSDRPEMLDDLGRHRVPAFALVVRLGGREDADQAAVHDVFQAPNARLA